MPKHLQCHQLSLKSIFSIPSISHIIFLLLLVFGLSFCHHSNTFDCVKLITPKLCFGYLICNNNNNSNYSCYCFRMCLCVCISIQLLLPIQIVLSNVFYCYIRLSSSIFVYFPKLISAILCAHQRCHDNLPRNLPKQFINRNSNTEILRTTKPRVQSDVYIVQHAISTNSLTDFR